jgi:hypothetical protein
MPPRRSPKLFRACTEHCYQELLLPALHRQQLIYEKSKLGRESTTEGLPLLRKHESPVLTNLVNRNCQRLSCQGHGAGRARTCSRKHTHRPPRLTSVRVGTWTIKGPSEGLDLKREVEKGEPTRSAAPPPVAQQEQQRCRQQGVLPHHVMVVPHSLCMRGR